MMLDSMNNPHFNHFWLCSCQTLLNCSRFTGDHIESVSDTWFVIGISDEDSNQTERDGKRDLKRLRKGLPRACKKGP
jgi:hypothetical protein